MPRRARITLANTPHHIIQRGNNRSACFYVDDDYFRYLDWLEKYSLENGCRVHAYVLMTNHVHLLITPETFDGLAKMMKCLGQRYVQYINRTYNRSGTLWEGRFKSCITQEDKYVLSCYRYIELNPVRAGMVTHPAEYPWSSYRSNAQQEPNKIISPHDSYLALGRCDEGRQRQYREIFKSELSPNIIDQVRAATNSNYALGSERFRAETEEGLGRRVGPGIPGRPRS
jgi:putative transposase